MRKSLLQLAERLVHGRILGPDELRTECNHLKQRPALVGYALGGWVTDDEAALLENTRAPHGLRFAVVGTSGGARAALATIQSGTLQVRWFVPLVGERARAWLRWCLSKSEFSYFVDVGHGKQVSWGSTALRPSQQAAVQALLAKPQALDYGAVFAELAVANAQYAYDEAVPSCLPGIAVGRVRLIAVCDALFGAIPSPGQQTH